jgi:hypothetical protein
MGNILDAFLDAIELDHLDDERLAALETMFADVSYPITQD